MQRFVGFVGSGPLDEAARIDTVGGSVWLKQERQSSPFSDVVAVSFGPDDHSSILGSEFLEQLGAIEVQRAKG
jgi:hypothetical protein